jgi:predicted anti-sigma-YlaC factor YlaD
VPDRDDQQPGNGPDEAALAIVARHALHDEELVAALAAGALDGEDDADERARARGFVDRCPACRSVHDDVAAIVAATRADARFTAATPRDFRLTVEDAHRLGGTVVTRGAVASLVRAVLGVARPVGASLAALGIVGVLVGSAVLGAAGFAQAPAADSGGTTAGMPVASAAAAAAPSQLEIGIARPKASDRQSASEPTFGVEDAVQPGAAAWLLWASILALIVGVTLFILGVRATRSGGSDSRGP